MKIRAAFFDLGGVLLRTEDRGPRTRLAQSLGMTYDQIDQAVFMNDSSLKASLGVITESQHWQNVAQSLGVGQAQVETLQTGFFAGDRLDQDLLALIRSMHQHIKVGLISNAWSGMRSWITSQKVADLFDEITLSAEVGLVKPDARIYQKAMESLQVLPQESLFVDDTLKNVEAARALGMHWIHFTDPELAKSEIRRLVGT